MILLDTNQIMISNLFAMYGKKEVNDLDINQVRHAVLKGILYYHNRFKDKYGDMVLCYDTNNYWRTEVFPQYKAPRKNKQTSSNIDWSKVYGLFTVIKKEIKENFRFASIEVPTVEADDIISSVCKSISDEEILIISSDKDFQQLQHLGNVKQYSPAHKDFLVCEDPEWYLKNHIIRGDSSDGIPNILSDDDTFTDPDKKQTIMNKKRFNMLYDMINSGEIENSDFCESYDRNKTLIDFNSIPDDKNYEILEAYQNAIDLRNSVDENRGINFINSNGLNSILNDLERYHQKIDV